MKNVKQILEFCFRHESDIIRAVEEKRMDMGTITGGGGHCRISDPTAQKAITNMSDVSCVEVEYGPSVNGKRSAMLIRRPLQWLKVAHWTKDYYTGRLQGELIRLKYGESRLRNDITKRLNISQATYYVMLTDIFTFAEGAARGMGLISVSCKKNYDDSRIDSQKYT